MVVSRSNRSFLLLAVAILALATVAFAQHTDRRGRKYKAPPPTSRIEVLVVRDEDGKPVENAAVVFHLVGDKGNMELKSNEDGKAMIDVLPTGSTVLLQIIAKGYQTYGEEQLIDDPVETIEVRLNRPGRQYSIYQTHVEKSGDKNKPADSEKKSGKSAGEKPADKDQAADSAKSPDAKPDASQPKPE